MNGPDPTGVLDLVLDRLDRGHHPAFILGSDEQLVPAVSMIDHDWLAEQLRLRGLRWGTDDARVLATLWWYSASAWMVCPTLASLALGGQVLSADCDDLAVHWLPDSQSPVRRHRGCSHRGPHRSRRRPTRCEGSSST